MFLVNKFKHQKQKQSNHVSDFQVKDKYIKRTFYRGRSHKIFNSLLSNKEQKKALINSLRTSRNKNRSIY